MITSTRVPMARECGVTTNSAMIEQLVFNSPDACKRADLVTLTPEGRKFACDVVVTASPAPAEPHAQHLHRMVTAKARQYSTVPWGKCHEDATFVLLLRDALHHWMPPNTLQLLHRAVMAVARRSAPEAPNPPHAHHPRVRGSPSCMRHVLLLGRCMLRAAASCEAAGCCRRLG